MTTTSIIILIAIGVYLVGMLAIGFKYSNNKTSEDFYLGGRKLGPIVTAMSTEASDMSAYLLMGVPGLALFCGVAEASWTAIGLSIGTWLNWLIVAKRLRRYSAKLHSITVPDFLAARFRDNTKLIEIIGALVIIVFFVPYTASGFVACGKLPAYGGGRMIAFHWVRPEGKLPADAGCFSTAGRPLPEGICTKTMKGFFFAIQNKNSLL